MRVTMWIPSKNQRPELESTTFPRIDLLRKLESCPHSFILLHAPAGYGKSCLIASWLSDKQHIGWINLDQFDNDPDRFARYLDNAIGEAKIKRPSGGTVLSHQSLLTYVTHLIDSVEESNGSLFEDSYLVLDNYQYIDHPEINNALKMLIHNRMPSLRVVVISRSLPNIGIANLRAKQQLLELTQQDLAFRIEETLNFTQQRFGECLDQATLQEIQDFSRGWPAALQLLALQSNHQITTYRQFARTNSPFQPTFIWDYFSEEIYDQLEIGIKHFLLKTSAVDEFNLELAEAIVPEQSPAEAIDYLSRNGLFITILDNGWYCYHPLFIKFLSNRRQITFGANEAQLQRTISNAWEKQNQPTKSLLYALLAEDTERMSRLVECFGWHLFHQGELHLLELVLIQLDDSEQAYDPSVVLLKAWILQMQFRYSEVKQQIEQCLAHLAEADIEINNNIRGEFNALLAQVAINQNQPELARERAEFSLLHLDHASYRARLIATSVLGEVCHVEGSLSQALSLMQQTEKYARQHQFNHQVLWALVQQIEIHTAMSHSQTAFELQTNALDYAKRHELDHLPLFDLILRLRVKLLCDWNRLNEAEGLINQRMESDSKLSEYSHLPALLARIAFLKGNTSRVNDLIGKQALDLISRDTHLDWQAELGHILILLWLKTDNKIALQQWVSHRFLPRKFSNHFSQQQGRNQVLALIGLNNYAQADQQLNQIEADASEYTLTCDQFRNRLLHCKIALLRRKKESAKMHLIAAIEASLESNYIGEFSLYGECILPLLEEIKLLQGNRVLMKHRIDLLIEQLEPSAQHTHALNQYSIKQLSHHATLPDVLKTSPLTNREWQVLTLIYSGLSNEQIAYQIDIAPTTLKTHIRNLYQKLNIPNRKAAKAFAEQLIALVNQ